jgi:uncharacterized membrane protein YfcA
MIGVTATAGAVIYYGHGQLNPTASAAAVLGVMCGSSIGIRLGDETPATWLKLLMAAVLIVVSVLMFIRSGR